MNKSTVRSITGVGLVLGHVVAFLLIFYRLDSYTPSLEAKLGLILAIAPITGAFALAATRYIISAQSRSQPQSHRKGIEKYDYSFGILAILLPLGFVFLIVLELWLYPYGVSSNLDSLRLSLGMMETGLGLVVGAFVEELFGIKLKSIIEEVSEPAKNAGERGN